VRIDTLTYNNVQTQGAQQRTWLRQHSPQHLEQCAALVLQALKLRQPSASQSALVLGAGACTEIPLDDLVRASDETVLVDFDLAAIRQGRDELASPVLRKRVRLLQCDITGGVSANLNRLVERQPWVLLVPQGPQAVFDAATCCLQQCLVPDPPQVEGLDTGEFGVVISSLVLSQLFSYPLLDILDLVQRITPAYLGQQERHRGYQEAAQAFRARVILAHLHLLRGLLDVGGIVVLLTDVRGFVFNVNGTRHDAEYRRTIPLVPRNFPDFVREKFTVIEEAHWDWLTDLPGKNKPGRGYEVTGYVMNPSR